MYLKIHQLNADTTFLLTFTASNGSISSDFTILIDPWLQGHSSILHPAFQISHHTSDPSINSITDLEREPDLIIISQDKPDHCHRETLCTLPSDTRIEILATPAAAKKIKSWKYFDTPNISFIPAFNAANDDTLITIPISPNNSSCTGGRLTVTNIPTKFDLTKLHNAVGITYQPSTSTTPLSNTNDTISVLYTPHGVSTSALEPYMEWLAGKFNIQSVDVLFHSINVEQNPRIMGGLVASGAPVGVEMAKRVKARHWIGAHDEVKDNKGMATLWIKSRQYELKEVESMLDEAGCGGTKLQILDVGEVLCIQKLEESFDLG